MSTNSEFFSDDEWAGTLPMPCFSIGCGIYAIYGVLRQEVPLHCFLSLARLSSDAMSTLGRESPRRLAIPLDLELREFWLQPCDVTDIGEYVAQHMRQLLQLRRLYYGLQFLSVA